MSKKKSRTVVRRHKHTSIRRPSAKKSEVSYLHKRQRTTCIRKISIRKQSRIQKRTQQQIKRKSRLSRGGGDTEEEQSRSRAASSSSSPRAASSSSSSSGCPAPGLTSALNERRGWAEIHEEMAAEHKRKRNEEEEERKRKRKEERKEEEERKRKDMVATYGFKGEVPWLIQEMMKEIEQKRKILHTLGTRSFRVGDKVTWVDSDEEIPKGTVGEVKELSEFGGLDWCLVSFPGKVQEAQFEPKNLRYAEEAHIKEFEEEIENYRRKQKEDTPQTKAGVQNFFRELEQKEYVQHILRREREQKEAVDNVVTQFESEL